VALSVFSPSTHSTTLLAHRTWFIIERFISKREEGKVEAHCAFDDVPSGETRHCVDCCCCCFASTHDSVDVIEFFLFFTAVTPLRALKRRHFFFSLRRRDREAILYTHAYTVQISMVPTLSPSHPPFRFHTLSVLYSSHLIRTRDHKIVRYIILLLFFYYLFVFIYNPLLL
jgi:hypothetical protein